MAISIPMHFPADLSGWAIFVFGLLMVAYRIHGIDAPRTWIEWIERQFTYAINLRFIGGILLFAVGATVYYARPEGVAFSFMFIMGMSVLGLVGFCLLLLQNHLRSLVLATAEGSDRNIRIVSVIMTIAGLGFMLAPFFI